MSPLRKKRGDSSKNSARLLVLMSGMLLSLLLYVANLVLENHRVWINLELVAPSSCTPWKGSSRRMF